MLVSLAHLFINVLLVGWTARRLLQTFKPPAKSGGVEMRLCGLFLLATGAVCLVVLTPGYLGILSSWSITAGQLTLAVLVYLLTTKNSRQPPTDRTADKPPAPFDRASAVCLVLLGVLATVLLVTNLLLPPLDYDSVGYRLSRIGLWLQDGSLLHTPTNDLRMNYTSFNGDLLILWLVSPFAHGYPLAGLPQWLGGAVLLLSALGFARILQLSLHARLCLFAVYLTMPVVLGQSMSTQVDLLFAGLLGASLLWLYTGLREGASPWVAWAGMGVALGVKGSYFYLAPGLLILGLIWLWPKRKDRKLVMRHLKAAIICLTVLGMPRYAENWIHYGNPFAPDAEIERIHGEDTGGFHLNKLGLNLFSYNLEQLNANANPPIVDAVTGKLALWLAEHFLDESDEHTFATDRLGYYRLLNTGKAPSELSHQASWGVLPPLLALAGLIMAVRNLVSRSMNRTQFAVLLAFTLMSVCYLLLFCGLFKWSAEKYRFFLPLVPVMLLFAGYGIEQLPARARQAAFVILAAYALLGFGKYYTSSTVTGLPGLMTPTLTSTGKTLARQQWMLTEEVPPGSRLAVCLPFMAPLNNFYRGQAGHTTLLTPAMLEEYASAEAFLKSQPYDFLIADPELFLNRPGQVYARACNWRTDHHRFMNFVLYRLQTAEDATHAYLHAVQLQRSNDPNSIAIDYILVPLDSAPLSVRFHNPLDRPVTATIINRENDTAARAVLALGKGGRYSLEHSNQPIVLRVVLTFDEAMALPKSHQALPVTISMPQVSDWP